MKISTDASSCKTWDQFRDYTDEEWNGTTNQVYTMMPDLSFAAAGVYEGYVMYANDKIARKTGTITVKPLSFSLLSSNSESGPFVSNGTVDVGKPLFARVTGVDKNNPPRGCMGMV